MSMLASLIRLAAAVVIGLIVVAIVLVFLKADTSNGIVSWINDAGSSLSSPFHGIFDAGARKWDVLVNWGLAAVVYSVVSAVLLRLVGGGGGYGRRTTVA